MAKMDKEFRIDFALKNLLCFIGFMILCIFCIVKILMPQIDEYKKQALESRKSRIAFNQVNKDYQAVEAQLKALSVQHYRILTSLHKQADDTALLALLQTQFNDIRLKKLESTDTQNITDTRYQISGYAINTQDIENFILWVNTIPYFAKVELPIKMEFDEKSKQIYFVAIMSLKHSTYKEHQIILDNQLRFDYFKP